jgi:hypothetical protein
VWPDFFCNQVQISCLISWSSELNGCGFLLLCQEQNTTKNRSDVGCTGTPFRIKWPEFVEKVTRMFPNRPILSPTLKTFPQKINSKNYINTFVIIFPSKVSQTFPQSGHTVAKQSDWRSWVEAAVNGKAIHLLVINYKVSDQTRGANPTIASYNVSAVKFYEITNSLVRFGNKNIYLHLNTLCPGVGPTIASTTPALYYFTR